MRAGLVVGSLVAVVCMGMMLPAVDGRAQGTPSANPNTAKVCPVTLPGPEVYNVGNYGNDALATDLAPDGVTVIMSDESASSNGPYGTKAGWFIMTPGVLTITGRRLDAKAPALKADISARSATHGFVMTGIEFSTLGCWEVTGHVAGNSLTFVTLVTQTPGTETGSATATSAGVLAQGTPISQPGMNGVCPVSLPGPKVFNVGNYGNDALATDLPPGGVIVFTPKDGTPVNGPFGTKIGWFRVTPGELTITGRRLDATAPPLTAKIPASFGTHGFIPTGVTFPTLGCWEVTGRIPGKSLTFVTMVIQIPGAETGPATATPAASPPS